MASPEKELLTGLLKDVSRSFYLTLRVLPRRIRPQIGLAYLLARTTDTIADTAVLPLEKRTEALQLLRERILGTGTNPIDFERLASHQSVAVERELLLRSEESLDLLQTFQRQDVDKIRRVLDTIISGQELDLRRFGSASAGHIETLKTGEELDDYTYRVAGCVGEFWTRICREHLFPSAAVDEGFLLSNSVRFGKGLQLVNILRDLPRDLRQGRCYLPGRALAQCGLSAESLLDPFNESRFRPVYDTYLSQAEDHLLAGWAYTNALPRSCIRVCLACAWPILIGLKTIHLLRIGKVLDPIQPLKISRAEIRKFIWRSIVYYPWPAAWQRLARL